MLACHASNMGSILMFANFLLQFKKKNDYVVRGGYQCTEEENKEWAMQNYFWCNILPIF